MTLGLALRCVALRCDAIRCVGQRVHSSQNARGRKRVQTAKKMESSSSDSSSEEEDLMVLLLALRGKRRKKRQRSVWVRQIFAKRRQQGEYHNLLQEVSVCVCVCVCVWVSKFITLQLRLIDPESHFRYLRMSRERFDNLLSQVSAIDMQLRSYVFVWFIAWPIPLPSPVQ